MFINSYKVTKKLQAENKFSTKRIYLSNFNIRQIVHLAFTYIFNDQSGQRQTEYSRYMHQRPIDLSL